VKRYRWLILTACLLIILSAGLYAVHFAIFKDAGHIFIYLLGDIAFVPLEVLLVALIIERLLARRERHRVFQKLNMLIGAFFSELGTTLLGRLAGCLVNQEEVLPDLAIRADWSSKDFNRSRSAAAKARYELDLRHIDLNELRDLLHGSRGFLLSLLANPNLLEHERFAELLWAVLHFQEELEARDELTDLTDTDRAHLEGDAERVFRRLATEWLLYCRHLKRRYPYIFSIVVRTHPLQPNPSATVE